MLTTNSWFLINLSITNFRLKREMANKSESSWRGIKSVYKNLSSLRAFISKQLKMVLSDWLSSGCLILTDLRHYELLYFAYLCLSMRCFTLPVMEKQKNTLIYRFMCHAPKYKVKGQADCLECDELVNSRSKIEEAKKNCKYGEKKGGEKLTKCA